MSRSLQHLRWGARALVALVMLSLQPVMAMESSLARAVDEDFSYVEDLYQALHAAPELSFKEEQTAATLAAQMTALGFDVTERVGQRWARAIIKQQVGTLHEGVDGYGLVAVLENGDGPTVMIRTDMDGLPIEEKTDLAYKSVKVMDDYLGNSVPVMHGCGHDVHMASWVGVARQLVNHRDDWSGTLVMIAQPAEELGRGARSMIADGLFKKFPRPDYNLALHVTGTVPAGSVAYTSGYALASVDSVDIQVKGIGGHGAYPHLAKDPIVIASRIVDAIQTLVARELNPLDDGVVTVGAFQAGHKHNIIPDSAHLQLTVRSYKPEVREQLLGGIRRIAKAQALSAGLPEALMPVVNVAEYPTAATYNDPALSARAGLSIKTVLGDDSVYEVLPTMGGEDFGFYGAQDPAIPSFIFWVGGADPQAFAAAQQGKSPMPPSNHSPHFAPQADPALRVGVLAMTAAALDLFARTDNSDTE